MNKWNAVLYGAVAWMYLMTATSAVAAADPTARAARKAEHEEARREREAARLERQKASSERRLSRANQGNNESTTEPVNTSPPPANTAPTPPPANTPPTPPPVNTPPTPTPPPANTPPTITGTPSTAVEHGSAYAFMPVSHDADGDFLTFSITGRPIWAHFDSVTGELFGTPTNDTDVGVTDEISISVNDGAATATLPSFHITVTSVVSETPEETQGDSLVTLIQPAAYKWNIQTFGELVYVDRNYTFVTIPAIYEGWRYLKTANNDKSRSAPDAVSFTINKPARVTVAYDQRISVLPGWLHSWTATGWELVTTDVPFDIYRKDFPAGVVTLGGNEVGFSMYSVAIAPLDEINDAVSPPDNPDKPADPNDVASQPDKPAAPNAAPKISGSPPTSVAQDVQYFFAPSATDDNGDLLTFSIINKPGWAKFNTSTGELWGIPTGDDVDVYRDIVVSVTDDQDSVSLQAFNIEVIASAAMGSAFMTWTPPTENEDGTPLTDLAGFEVLYGRELGQYDYSKTLPNPGLTTYMVEELTGGKWYFTVIAYDFAGNKSRKAVAVSKMIP